MPYLLSHTWPGNVRELRNFALRFVLGLDEDGSLYKRESRSPPLADQVSWFEKEIIVQQLRRYGGNVEAASEVLAVPKTTLYEKLRKHSICARALKCANDFGGVDVRMKGADGHVVVVDQNP
jgi:two-component system C4-dicarboxylate transport response regulator DctD